MSINQTEFEDFVYLNVLENAVQHAGNANPKAIIGRCVPKFPEMKQNMGQYVQIINKITQEVNSLSEEIQKQKLQKLNPNALEKKEKIPPKKSDGLPILPNTENGVIVRFPPAPSGYLHLGHLFGIVANYEFKKKYGGKFILRLEDTNPDNIDLENYDKVIEDVKWITDDNIDEIYYQSDRLQLYHKSLRTLFELGHCYVCNCDSETFKALTDNKEACHHRKLDFEKKKELFEQFMEGKFEGVVRANADLENKNPALRSFPLARINRSIHPRLKNEHVVWPNYNLAVTVDDYLMKLTHVIRGKDLEIGKDRQEMLFNALNWKTPEYFHYGRMKFTDIELSKTKLSEKIESGEFDSWSDPRVPSILSHKKRGYQPEAFRKYILSLGISKRDSKISKDEYYKGLNYFNKQILETTSNRYFTVNQPKTVNISNILEFKEKELKLQKHPEDKSKGFRIIKVESQYLIEQKDFDQLNKGDKLRLMHFANFEIEEKTDDEIKVKYISKEYDKNLGVKKNIHFVSKTNNEQIQIIMPDNTKILSTSEKIDKYEIGNTFQFERFGFVRLDRIEDNIKVFYFTHK